MPVDPSLQGAVLMTQFVALDPPLDALGMPVSNALETSLRRW